MGGFQRLVGWRILPSAGRLIALLVVLAAAMSMAWWIMIRMPGKSFAGAPPSLPPDELALQAELVAHVKKLAGEIGERNVQRYDALVAASDYVAQSFTDAGLRPRRDGYELQGKLCENIEVEIPGARPEIFIVGAHYDSVFGSPGANDNGSGVAALLALARRFAGKQNALILRFVAFTNEEPFHFQSPEMGSWVYASRCKARGDRIGGMISLETVGYFSEEAGSQNYPMTGLRAIYPRTGNFIAFVGDVSSRALVREAIGSFRRHGALPSEGAALPAKVPGVGWSDQWAFWAHGYRGIMITDTAPFRYPHYHARSDTPDKINYASMTRLVAALEKTVRDLANPSK